LVRVPSRFCAGSRNPPVPGGEPGWALGRYPATNLGLQRLQTRWGRYPCGRPSWRRGVAVAWRAAPWDLLSRAPRAGTLIATTCARGEATPVASVCLAIYAIDPTMDGMVGWFYEASTVGIWEKGRGGRGRSISEIGRSSAVFHYFCLGLLRREHGQALVMASTTVRGQGMVGCDCEGPKKEAYWE